MTDLPTTLLLIAAGLAIFGVGFVVGVAYAVWAGEVW